MKKSVVIALSAFGSFCAYAQDSDADTIRRTNTIEEVELFGERGKNPEKLEVITRLPLKTREQIQSISVISYKVIEDLGGLTVTDVAKNIPGVTQFGSYGGVKESMSIRGYRGVPVLKNGVMMDSDFRTGSMLTEMQGVETIQVIKGSAAVTQGIGDGLGAAGGVINVVTKIPKFQNATKLGFRYGSWDFYRPTLDFERVLDTNGRVAVRFNAAYQNSNSFRKYVSTERIYVNPSIAIRPDHKTEVVVEMDFMDNNTTPDRGTVNLASGSVNALYKMPKGKFLGFSSDNAHTQTFNFSTSATRRLTDKLKLRAAYISSNYDSESIGAALSPVDSKNPNEFRNRTLAKSGRNDLNKVFQFDFIGQDVQTGFLKHTFQVGMDWKQSDVTTTTYKAYQGSIAPSNAIKFIDQINVLQDIPNALPYDVVFEGTKSIPNRNPTLGFMVQDVVSFGKYAKAHLGLRYSKLNGSSSVATDAWNPSFGLMLFPVENVNVFGSYTTTTSLRSANNALISGGTIGASNTKQWEAGIKSDWLGEKLRFNVTYFDIKTNNLSFGILDENYNPVVIDGQTMYGLAGSLHRSGLEIELIGRILPNLQIMSGWALLNAKYQDSPSYVNGSSPMNAPKHTANAWLNYKFVGGLRGLDVGAGIYYVGARPVDEWTQKSFTAGHVNSVLPGEKPFMMNEYTTVDAQVGYTLNNGLGIRVFLNNIFDAVGYNSYFRGGYIDQINPRNMAVQLNYKF